MREFAGLFLCALLTPAFAQSGGDLQARIMYAYQTEDLHELGDLVQSLRIELAAGNHSAALRYDLAHADYRDAQLDAQLSSRSADEAASGCVKQLAALIERDPRSVEALALQAACYTQLARLRRFEGPLLLIRASQRLRQARHLAPRNPRVLYLWAKFALARARPGSAAATRALRRLRAAARRFEQTSATRRDVPTWGHAEAYLALGHQLRLRGDSLGARNWIERALISSPDYRAAQRELARLEAH